MSLLQQFIQLLSEPPGNVVYHVISLLAIQVVLALAWWQLRRDPADSQARRLTWAAGGILLGRLAVIVVSLLLTGPEAATAVLPPLEQAIDAATAALLVWALAPQLKSLPRLGTVLLFITLLFIGFMYAYFAQEWARLVEAGTAAIGYNNFNQAAVWGALQMGILALGALLMIIGRRSQWPLRLVILLILLAAHFASVWNAPEAIPTGTDIAYWIRLGNLIAFPLLAVLAYRHNLSSLLAESTAARLSGADVAHYLQLSRAVIRSLDLNWTLYRALDMIEEIIPSPFAALAVLGLDDPDHLHLVSQQLPEPESTPASEPRQQSWALKLSDWPAIRLAMQQRQRVELIHNGLGARQLNNFYHELGLSNLGSLLIEPLLIEGEELGVLLLAGPADRERWPTEDKAMSGTSAAFVAQAVDNTRRHQRALRQSSAGPAGDETLVSGRLIAMEQARDQALTELETLRGRLQQTETLLTEQSLQSRNLAATVTMLQQTPRDETVAALEEEIRALRESLLEAEEAMAMAATVDGGVSPEWVTMAITRYSGELEDAQARIQQLEARLSQQEEAANSDLIMSLAQELRTPLTSLGGYTELLLGESMGILGTKQLNLLRRIEANVQHMAGLLEQIIHLADEDRFPSDRVAKVDVREAVESAVAAIGTEMQLKSLYLDMDVADDLPPIPSEGDAFFQIVTYLLRNACQVSAEESHVTVSISHDTLREPKADKDHEPFSFLHLQVSDSGGLQSQEIHDLILESHRRLDEELQRQVARVGHNLNAAVDLITAHGGRVWVEADDKAGSTFSVLLPLSTNGTPAGKRPAEELPAGERPTVITTAGTND
jgi:signal transduction histidine kinase